MLSNVLALRARRALPLMIASALAALTALPSAAQDSPWRLRVGVGRVNFDASATVTAGGNVVPGASADFSDNTTLLVEGGYRFDPTWSLNLGIGIPPKTTGRGTGTAAPFGELGKVTYGPMTLTGQYQWATGSALRPYVAAGVAYDHVFKEQDGAIASLHVKDSWGSVLQAGTEYRLSPTLSLYLDVKKVWLKAKATGTLHALGGAPAQADLTLNPLVVQAGIAFDF